MSDRKLRHSVSNFGQDVREEPRAMSPKLSGKITGFLGGLISSSDDHKCHICNEDIRHFDPALNICKKCSDETCKAHIRMQAITEENKQLMCASCAQMVELETIRLTCIQQADQLKALVKEREKAKERLSQTSEELRTRILALERAISDAESQSRLQVETFQSDMLLEDDRKRKILEEVYSLSQDYKEMSTREQEARQVTDTLELKCYCMKQEAEHAKAACEDLGSQLETQNAEMKLRVPVANLKKMVCRDCYFKVKSVYKDSEEGQELFGSVSGLQQERLQPLEQFSCVMSCKSAYARLKYL